MYRLYMQDAAILKFKMAAITGQILRGTDPQNFYNYKSTSVQSFMLLSKNAQSLKKLLHIRPARRGETHNIGILISLIINRVISF